MAKGDLRSDGRIKGGVGDTTKSSITRFALRSADIRGLYETARSLGGIGGAPYLNRLFDAESALSSDRLDRVREILTMTRQEFEKSHGRILRYQPEGEPDSSKAAKEQARILLRKEQVEDVLAKFDEYVTITQRMSDRAERNGPKVQPASPSPPPERRDEADLPDGVADAWKNAETTDGQFDVVQRYFDYAAVASREDVASGGLFFLRTRASGYILRIAASAEDDAIQLADVLTRQNLRPQPLEALLEQGIRGKLFSLVRRKQAEAAVNHSGNDNVPRDELPDAPSADPLEAQNALLDRQLFNVLMTAVRNSGQEISTELIVQVRDNEFRKGEYLDAFEKLNQLSTRYEVMAARRKEELRRHDQWLASGQSGLSLREVEEAKLRNAQERTRLEHASHRFGLVVEPLRILSRGKP
jgi:hypothetical protein